MRELIEEKRSCRKSVQVEGIEDTCTSDPPGVQTRDPSVNEILVVCEVNGSDSFGILWLLDFGMLVVTRISVVRVLEFILPTLVVRIGSCVCDLIELSLHR